MLTEAYKAGSADGREGWRIRFTYDADKIEALKAHIPSNEREWNDEQKYWWVSEAYTERLLKLFPAFEAFKNQIRLF